LRRNHQNDDRFRIHHIAACVLVAVATIIAPATPPSPSPVVRRAHAATESADEALQRIVFATPLDRFRLERSRAVRLHRFDATTDGCSAPLLGSEGRSFNFRLPCERHDFAYRNYWLRAAHGGPAWNAVLRAAIDDQFQRDLQSVCAKRRGSFRLRCDAWVIVFFHAVRLTAGP
jgi:hypothetical protein